jgi:asparagine synthase (glutamine-hydrolysing)
MCGICGIYNFDKTKINFNALKKINSKLIERGPDSGGIFCEKNIGLGVRRLEIIDFKGGKQPFYNDNRTIVLVFNGEIYNYIELRNQLENLGFIFKTKSDTEVLLKLYEAFGEKMLGKINGMFAFSIWDKSKNKLLIARDRIGIKPLYYKISQNNIIFSSTLNSFVDFEKKKKLNEDSLLFYLFLGYIPSPNTIWKKFHKLKPGHCIIIEKNKIKIKNYWNLKININRSINSNNVNDYLKKIKKNIINSNEIQSRSDANIGIFLSGGVDSSILTKLFVTNSKKKFNTYTIDFEKKDKEIDNVKLLTKKEKNINSIYKFLKISENKYTFKKILNLYDEPNSDSASIANFLLSNIAKKKKDKVIITGSGGDELFGGYDRYYIKNKFYFGNFLNKIKLFFNYKKNFFSFNDYLLNYEIKLCNPTLRFATNTSGVNLAFLKKILNKNFFDRGCKLISRKFSIYQSNYRKHGPAYAGMLTDIKFYLPDNILYIADQTSMNNSIEIRVPFLDHRIANQIFKIPPKLFLGKNFNKSKNTLKNFFKNLINSKILSSKKIGFNTPANKWVENETLYFKKEILKESKTVLKNYVNFSEINKILNSKKKIKIYSNDIFSLFCIKKWLDIHE